MSGFTTTPIHGLLKPAVGGDDDAWGGHLNSNADTIDRQIPLILTTAGPASLTGVTTETNLAALRIPAGVMGANGVIEIKALWSYPNSSNAKTLTMRFNATAGATTGGLFAPAASATTSTEAQTFAIIRNNNSAAAQVAFNQPATTPFGVGVPAYSQLAVDTTADAFVNINGTLASAAETLILVHAYAVVFPR
jgi:hypothetical protein